MNSARDLGRTLCRVRRGSIKVATKKSVTTLGDKSPSRAHLTGRGPQDQAARSPGTWTLHPADLPTRLPAGSGRETAARAEDDERFQSPRDRASATARLAHPVPARFLRRRRRGLRTRHVREQPDEVPAACRVGSGRRLQDRGDGSKTRVSREDSNSGRQVPRLARNQGI